MKYSTSILILFSLFVSLLDLDMYSQNDYSQWCFGTRSGLNFLTNPPSITSSSLISPEGCTSIADASGNLLFYSNGMDVRTGSHSLMSNGSGLLGNSSACQAAVGFKKPNSNSTYCLLTLVDAANADCLRYHEIDMSLAAGAGSVTIKNQLVYGPSAEIMCVAKHCNGSDYWVITHEWNSATFRSYSVSSQGISSTPVLSSGGPVYTGTTSNSFGYYSYQGQMRLSPDARKIAVSNFALSLLLVADFDRTTGILSNFVTLNNGTSPYQSCEFSPDGTKLYLSGLTPNMRSFIIQYNLCAGSTAAIISSKDTVATAQQFGNMNGLQLGPDNKIYVAQTYSNQIAVINSPNLSAQNCNFQPAVYSLIAPKYVGTVFPQHPRPMKLPITPNFTQTINCSKVTFTPQISVNNNTTCSFLAFPINSYSWFFGEQGSAAVLNSTVSLVNHQYSASNTYTVKMQTNYLCERDSSFGLVTVTQVSPQFSVTGNTTICKGEKSILTVSGTYSYTWSNAATTNSIAITPTVSQVYSVVVTATNGCTSSATQSITVNKCTGISEATELEQLIVGPNPFQDKLLFLSKHPDSTLFAIYTMNGALVYKGRIEPGENVVFLSELPAGIYLLQVECSMYRIVKQ